MRYIDTHTHSYLRSTADLAAMSSAGVEGVAVCSYFPVRPTGPSTLVDLHRWIVDDEMKRLQSCGLSGKAAVGVHPRSIPSSGVDEVLQHMEGLFDSGAASALGEVGLETASREEEGVLMRQVAMAQAHDLPIIVHTPRQNKDEVFKKLVGLLLGAKVDPDRVVVDHLTENLALEARRQGFVAGVTVQPGKMTADDAVSIVSRLGAEGIVINSDLSNANSDPLTLPKVAQALVAQGIGAAEVERATYSNSKKLLRF